MPKVRCENCEKVLNVPDKAAGKSVACPQCKSKIRVPAARAVKSPTGPSSDALLKINLDDAISEDEEDQVCPYCAAELDPEDPVCRSCGMNVELGVMDKKEAYKRSIKGPDPGLFYSKVWSDSWEFILTYKSLGFRTAFIWLLFGSTAPVCFYMSFYYCKNIPTKAFWFGLMVVAGLGVPGWFMYLGLKMIQSAIFREEVRPDRIHFDYFQSVAGGMRTVFWPLVVMGPFTQLVIGVLGVAIPVAGLSPTTPWILAMIGITWILIPVLLFPIAMVHMTAKYTYKAWILWELLKVFVKNIGPTFYLYIVALVAVLPLATVALPAWLLTKDGNPFYDGPIHEAYAGLTTTINSTVGLSTDQEHWNWRLMKSCLTAGTIFVISIPFYLMAGFSGLFMMRAIGLFGYYNNNRLDLTQRMMAGTPATFWVRYLAHTIDGLFVPFTGFLVTSNAKMLTVYWMVLGGVLLSAITVPALAPITLPILGFLTHWMYWVGQEATDLKSTLGKDAFGLIVESWDEKPMTMKQASLKWFLRVCFTIDGGLPFLVSAFHPQKKCLHDIVTRSRVVWKGDR